MSNSCIKIINLEENKEKIQVADGDIIFLKAYDKKLIAKATLITHKENDKTLRLTVLSDSMVFEITSKDNNFYVSEKYYTEVAGTPITIEGVCDIEITIKNIRK